MTAWRAVNKQGIADFELFKGCGQEQMEELSATCTRRRLFFLEKTLKKSCDVADVRRNSS